MRSTLRERDDSQHTSSLPKLATLTFKRCDECCPTPFCTSCYFWTLLSHSPSHTWLCNVVTSHRALHAESPACRSYWSGALLQHSFLEMSFPQNHMGRMQIALFSSLRPSEENSSWKALLLKLECVHWLGIQPVLSKERGGMEWSCPLIRWDNPMTPSNLDEIIIFSCKYLVVCAFCQFCHCNQWAHIHTYSAILWLCAFAYGLHHIFGTNQCTVLCSMHVLHSLACCGTTFLCCGVCWHWQVVADPYMWHAEMCIHQSQLERWSRKNKIESPNIWIENIMCRTFIQNTVPVILYTWWMYL